MPYVDPKSLTLERHGRRLIVRNPFWSVTHDLDHGGAPVDIRFVRGTTGNILRAPIATRVDGRADADESRSAVQVKRLADGFELRFTNRLARAVYRYTPYWIRREVRLNIAAGRVTPLVTRFDDRFTHWGAAHDPATKPGRLQSLLGPHYDQVDGTVPAKQGAFFRDPRTAGWMNLFRLGGEGISVSPTGNLAAWGECRMARDPAGTSLQYEARTGELLRQPVFATFITLVNLTAVRPPPLRTVMVGNPPFPADHLLRAWAKTGVELIVIMEGASWVGGTDRYWRVGDYPCYHDPRDMRDLDRLIRSAHRFGMQIIPYTCPTYLHPEVPIFHRHAHEWRLAPFPNAQVIYQPAGKSPGGCYGALMCPDAAAWREYYIRHVKTLLAKHDFDGLYLDNVWKWPCFNTDHGPAQHGGLDGMWEVVGCVRRWLGTDRLMVIHNGEFLFQATSNNFADMIVTLEGIPLMKNFRYDLTSISRYVRAFSACGVSIVPRSIWYKIPPPLPKRLGLHDGIAKALLLGTVPYSYAMWETRWGYKDFWECLRDPRGIYAAFRKLKSLKLDGLRFENSVKGGIGRACYRGNDRRVVLVANVSGRPKQNIRWRCDEQSGVIRSLHADEYRFIELT
ncbi:MAG: hypothetical protein HY360_09950 [Verrucomicrobia bacterium]|nr:hypothetical protein [Verrucomicrobiota bacterium]